jgi:peptidoglycan/xylan/chitin deacetylase (PgdA/CDA1 family)
MQGVNRIQRWASRILPIPRAVILLYHRVASVENDPQLLCVSPQHFTEHLEVLRRSFHPMRLRSLRDRLAFKRWPRRTVALTFDDGYADSLDQSKSLLEAADVPATLFVVAGQLDSEKEFWWDELERIFLTKHELPQNLSLNINGREYTWPLESNGKDDRPVGPWNILTETDPTARHTAYRELVNLLRYVEAEAREFLLEFLADWAGSDRVGRPAYRALTSEELSLLEQDGLVEIGAHTMTHPLLAALPVVSQRAEIVNSKQRLEEVLQKPVTSFSYPFGGRQAYTIASVRLVSEAGFKCACSNVAGVVRWGQDPYQLPRFLVRDWDGAEFARRLETMFHS